MGGLRFPSEVELWHQMEADIQAKRFPMITFTKILNAVSQLLALHLFFKNCITNPTEKYEDVFEKDPPPFPIEGPVVGEYPCGNDEVVEHEEGDEGPIQRRSPVLIEIRGSRTHDCYIRTGSVPESQESGHRRILTKS